MNTLNELLTISAPRELISLDSFLLSIFAALALGLIFSFAMQVRSLVSKSFAVTLAILPPVVCVVISMVNGSIGAGIAVAGTFSLVRFRSIPGSAREIVSVFLAMAIGLACAMGNLFYALLFTVISTAAFLILEHSRFGELSGGSRRRVLSITLPEEVDYKDILANLFETYTVRYKMTKVKTVGSENQFRLSFDVLLKDPRKEMEFLQQIRSRYGNLKVSCNATSNAGEGL